MKKIAILTLGPLAALAACGQSDDGVNQASVPDNTMALPEEIPVNDYSAVEPANEAKPVQRPPDAETSIPPVRREVPKVAPKSPPPPPPSPKPDPHAGHDMSNMANSQ